MQNMKSCLQIIVSKEKLLYIHRDFNRFLFFHSLSIALYRKPARIPLTGAAFKG